MHQGSAAAELKRLVEELNKCRLKVDVHEFKPLALAWLGLKGGQQVLIVAQICANNKLPKAVTEPVFDYVKEMALEHNSLYFGYWAIMEKAGKEEDHVVIDPDYRNFRLSSSFVKALIKGQWSDPDFDVMFEIRRVKAQMGNAPQPTKRTPREQWWQDDTDYKKIADFLLRMLTAMQCQGKDADYGLHAFLMELVQLMDVDEEMPYTKKAREHRLAEIAEDALIYCGKRVKQRMQGDVTRPQYEQLLPKNCPCRQDLEDLQRASQAQKLQRKADPRFAFAVEEALQRAVSNGQSSKRSISPPEPTTVRKPRGEGKEYEWKEYATPNAEIDAYANKLNKLVPGLGSVVHEQKRLLLTGSTEKRERSRPRDRERQRQNAKSQRGEERMTGGKIDGTTNKSVRVTMPGGVGALASEVTRAGNNYTYTKHGVSVKLRNDKGDTLSKMLGRRVCDTAFHSPLPLAECHKHCKWSSR
jgi:hypothetical protein